MAAQMLFLLRLVNGCLTAALAVRHGLVAPYLLLAGCLMAVRLQRDCCWNAARWQLLGLVDC
eukprot:6087240-Lingulodinium_polyedra.AAC.1